MARGLLQQLDALVAQPFRMRQRIQLGQDLPGDGGLDSAADDRGDRAADLAEHGTLAGRKWPLALERVEIGDQSQQGICVRATTRYRRFWISSQLFFLVTGIAPLSQEQVSLPALLPGVLFFALIYFLMNSWLMATVVGFEESISPVEIWRQNFLWLGLSFLSGASVSILLVSVSREISLTALAVVLPLLVISYLTYHSSMARVEDANRHVSELNHLYSTTIETLAMAIDAKDQVTHGHIRRVREHSVSLARRVGVDDEKLIRAIEAASLLHDMGKLAIPEHILNKPGKLTVDEFEVMKTHSSLGADILAAIEFPYPVVPIVRHHHENWDGSGYPDGLAGTEIPLGARILAVVDCFDALTSDRPYRCRLAVADAIAILRDRRGHMYDPLVVDVFMELQQDWPI